MGLRNVVMKGKRALAARPFAIAFLINDPLYESEKHQLNPTVTLSSRALFKHCDLLFVYRRTLLAVPPKTCCCILGRCRLEAGGGAPNTDSSKFTQVPNHHLPLIPLIHQHHDLLQVLPSSPLRLSLLLINQRQLHQTNHGDSPSFLF